MKECQHMNQAVKKTDKEAVQSCVQCKSILAKWNAKTGRMLFLAAFRKDSEKVEYQGF